MDDRNMSMDVAITRGLCYSYMCNKVRPYLCYDNIILALFLIPTTWQIIVYLNFVTLTIKISKLFIASTLTTIRDKIGPYRYSKMEVL